MTESEFLEGLDITSDGRPASPLRCLDLDAWAEAGSESISRAAQLVADALPLTVGLATRPVPPALTPLVSALTLTLAGPGVADTSVEFVPVADPAAAYSELVATATRRPQACVALGQLLRQTPLLGTTAGLAAEATVYSMLLGGTEFAAWRSEHAHAAASSPEAAPLRIARTGDSLAVVLDRPERRNALSFDLREALYAALEFAEADDTVDHVEISGSGAAFCSGGDLAEFGTATDLVAAYLVRLDRAPWRLIDRLRERLGDRMTVRVHGAAVGAGVEMAAFAGRVSCSPDAEFWLPEVEMGLVPGAGGTVSVVRRIGRWRAAWLMLTGSHLDARTALDWGLVDAIT